MTPAATSTLRIVTRGSALALWQASHVRTALTHDGAPAPELVIVRTTGDIDRITPLSSFGDRGLFTREVDDALLDDRADIAVHSAKDVPTILPEGLVIVAFAQREDPSDALVTRAGAHGALGDLPPGARVGSSSLRRRAQLAALRPDLQIVDLRGNVDTRIAKVHEGVVDAAILARAGLLRLGRADEASALLAAPEWLPAVGQGALALVMRADDPRRAAVAAALDHAPTRAAVVAERALLRHLEGGCQVPIGALASVDGERIVLDAAVYSLDGRDRVTARDAAPITEPEALGVRLAETLLRDGAGRILDAIRARASAPPEVPAP